MILLLMGLVALPITHDYDVVFKSCYDGDTCTFDIVLSQQDVQMGLGVYERRTTIKRDQIVRLCDINAPELKPPNAPATKARDDLTTWISTAKAVQLKVPQKKTCAITDNNCDQYEKYGRLLGYIFADDVNLNQKQLDTGNAVSFIQCK